ncbi:glycosyltransferase [Leifsonia shinshuensis]
MPQDFDHFVITRFAVRWRAEDPPPDEAWLRYRIGLFEAVCLPSVASQVGAEFTWLLLLDEGCRAPWLEAELAELGAGGVFEVVWLTDVFWSSIDRVVTERATAPHVITTRLDSDDAIARDYLGRVQATFDGQDRLYVNFQRGFQFERDGALYSYLHPANAFLSFIERRTENTPVRTVFSSTAHPDAAKYGDVLQVSAPPCWIIVVHGANLLNEVHPVAWRLRPEALGDRFEVALPLAPVTGRELVASRIRTLRHQAVRVFTRWRIGKQILLNLAQGDRVQAQRTDGSG